MSDKILAAAHARIAAMREEISAMELVSSGSLQQRMTRCGKPSCRCMTSKTRHGPYFEYGRMHAGKQVSTYVSKDEARLLRLAIKNYRRVRTLLRRWERETRRIVKRSAALTPDQHGR